MATENLLELDPKALAEQQLELKRIQNMVADRALERIQFNNAMRQGLIVREVEGVLEVKFNGEGHA